MGRDLIIPPGMQPIANASVDQCAPLLRVSFLCASSMMDKDKYFFFTLISMPFELMVGANKSSGEYTSFLLYNFMVVCWSLF